MKKFKLILKVLLGIVVVIALGYFIYTIGK